MLRQEGLEQETARHDTFRVAALTVASTHEERGETEAERERPSVLYAEEEATVVR